jgi:hypothetical protein
MPQPAGSIAAAKRAVINFQDAALAFSKAVVAMAALDSQRQNNVFDISLPDYANDATLGVADQTKMDNALTSATSLIGTGDYQNIIKVIRLN